MSIFCDKSNDVCGFMSNFKKERYVLDNCCQTSTILYQEKSVQSYRKKDSHCQTNLENGKIPKMEKDDSRKLLQFLHDQESNVIKQLQNNSKSRAFNNYVSQYDDATDAGMTCLHKLSQSEIQEEMSITDLSWNASGSVVIVAYGRLDHEDCCMHKSLMCTWNVDRSKLNPKKSDRSIELNSCLMCLACHSIHPSIVAGGTFNGEVNVWDLNRTTDSLLVSTGRGDDSHLEGVSGIKWVSDGEGISNKLFSVGGDGRMFLWRFDLVNKTLTLISGFVLLSESLPRNVKSKVGSQQLVSITCHDFSSFDTSKFVVGTDGGHIFQCSLLIKGTVAGVGGKTITMKSPVVSSFSGHRGPVHSIQFSPFHRNLFMSASCDGTFIIYSLLQSEPLKQIHTGSSSLFIGQWSPWKPTLVAVGTCEGGVIFYDVTRSNVGCEKKIGIADQVPVTSLRFNCKRPNLICTGDKIGSVGIWLLSSPLSDEKSNEKKALASLTE